ncbi:MAG: alkane 1-monooxygenase [Albidovulum sp.]
MKAKFKLPWSRRASTLKSVSHPQAVEDEATISSVLGAMAAEEHQAAPEAEPPAEAPNAQSLWFLPPALRNWFDPQDWRPLLPFLLITLSPLPFFLLVGFFGGAWSILALLWTTLALFVADEVLLQSKTTLTDTDTDAAQVRGDRLSILLAGVHFLLLPFAIWVLAGGAGLGFFAWIAAFFAFGLWFGQVANSTAHELIHRSDRWPFWTGAWIFTSLLFGHHTSAHRLVHHRFVATPDDPNTAAEGESFYTFALRAWPGAFVSGYEMECNLQGRRTAAGLRNFNPYWIYVGGAVLWVVSVGYLFGIDGVLAYLLLCAHAQLQLLLSDYVQHYGLLRRETETGGLEPAGAAHSWDAPHPVSALLMLNAPRHADHHAHPARPFPALQLATGRGAPLLPFSLPVMATIALVPRLWHRVMDRRLAALKAQWPL